MLSFQIVEKMTKGLRELVQATAQMQPLLSALDTEELDYIHRNVLISMVGASTRIENAILTDAEIDWIETTLSHDARTTAYLEKREYIHDKLSKDKERSIDEVTGCRALLQLIYAQAEDMFPLTETTLRGLHGELLRYYAPAAHYRGQYKTSPNNVIQENRRTGERSAVFETCPPGVLTPCGNSSRGITPRCLSIPGPLLLRLSLFSAFLPSILSRMETGGWQEDCFF